MDWKLPLVAAIFACLATLGNSYEAPDDCDLTFLGDSEEDGFGLTCHLSAINSNLEKTNFSACSVEFPCFCLDD